MVHFLFRNLKGYRFLIVVAVALTFAQVGATLLLAFPLKFILDKLLNHKDPHFPLAGLVLGFFDRLDPARSASGPHAAMAVILSATTLLVVLGLLNAGLTYVQLYLAAFIGQNLSARLRQKLFDHLQHLSLSWHGQQKTGDLVQRLIANVADIEKLVTDGLVDLLTSILTLAGMVLVLYLANWQFTLFSILIVPALFVVVLTLPGGSLTVGTLTLFLAYLKQLYQPMRDLSKLTYLTTVAAAGAERIQEVLAQPPEVLARPGAAPGRGAGATRLKGDIRYDHVAFGYLPEQRVLQDINLHLPA